MKLPFDRDVASSGTGLADGAFDASGRSLPGELLPARLTSGGVPFTLGSVAGSDLNAVAAEGQTLALPPSKGARRLSLLAAAEADVASTLRIGGRTVPWFVQAWDGFIGQWDNRIWKGEVPLKTFAWKNELAGIAPAFIKRAPLAWYADHHRLPSGTNDPYRFAYLYRYDFEVPAEVSTITLPGDPRIKVLGATVTRAEPLAIPTEPLYERGMGGPPKF